MDVAKTSPEADAERRMDIGKIFMLKRRLLQPRTTQGSQHPHRAPTREAGEEGAQEGEEQQAVVVTGCGRKRDNSEEDGYRSQELHTGFFPM